METAIRQLGRKSARILHIQTKTSTTATATTLMTAATTAAVGGSSSSSVTTTSVLLLLPFVAIPFFMPKLARILWQIHVSCHAIEP